MRNYEVLAVKNSGGPPSLLRSFGLPKVENILRSALHRPLEPDLGFVLSISVQPVANDKEFLALGKRKIVSGNQVVKCQKLK